AHGYAEEGEERKGSEVHLAFLDAVEFAQFAYLCGEHPVIVHDALGRACAAGGEQDCGCVIRPCRCTRKLAPYGFTDPGQRGAAPEPPPPDRDGYLHAAERAREEDAGCVRGGDRDEGFGCDLLDAA